MNKIIICFLLVTGMATALQAQNRNSADMPFNRAEFLYNFPKPGAGKASFFFFGLKNNVRVTIDLINIKQVKYLPNLDSLVNTIKPNLRMLADSFKNDVFSRRIDYLVNGPYPQIRIHNYDKEPQQFVVKEGALNQLKTDQDTIRIKAYMEVAKEDILNSDLRYYPTNKPEMQPYFIMIILNNCADLLQLPDNSLQACVTKLKTDLNETYIATADPKAKYNASFNLNTNKMFSPGKLKWIKNPGSVQELVPNIYAGLQYTAGTFVPSFSAGLRYTFANRQFTTKRIYAMWEPHFFFSKDLLNKTITDRNDFITLRYISIERGKKEPFDFVGNVSLGYLIRKQGNWFEPNTFKVGIPGVRSGWLQLEPEFFFHDFLKGVSPSIKLTIHYE
ncbi:MAG: hypothetical protein NTZ19_14020 [Bacteroidetes bacterium]|nr:hypothetical protein [Bacteroidota bacterium]